MMLQIQSIINKEYIDIMYKEGDKFIIELGKQISEDPSYYALKDTEYILSEVYIDSFKRYPAITVGDEVKVNCLARDGDELIYVVTRLEGNRVHGINKNGTIHNYNIGNLEKTGRHFYEVEKLLRLM